MPKVTSVVREDARAVVETLGPSLQPLSGTTFLVTGAAGFLCSTVLDVIAEFNRSAAARPCRILGVDNFRTGLPDRLEHLASDPSFRFVTHDVALPFEPGERVDWILHGAGIASPTFYRRYPLETIDVNVGGLRRMLDLSRSEAAKGILYLSTSEIYGDPEPSAVPTPETYRGFVSCTGPRACYDESKRLGETLCVTYHRLFATPVKVVRPFNVYGPCQRLDDRRIVPDLMAAALSGQPLVLLSDGRATRAFCYIRDFVTGLLGVLVAGQPGEAYNVGNDEEVTIREVAESVAAIAGTPPLAVELRASPDHDYLTDNPQRRCPDLSKVRTAIGYRPRVSLREGLERTFRSYRERPGAAA
jgi:UDP-glucuronate decarboxylase